MTRLYAKLSIKKPIGEMIAKLNVKHYLDGKKRIEEANKVLNSYPEETLKEIKDTFDNLIFDYQHFLENLCKIPPFMRDGISALFQIRDASVRENFTDVQLMHLLTIYKGNVDSMISAYKKETDDDKKRKMHHFMRDYIVKNHKVKCCIEVYADGPAYVVKDNMDDFKIFRSEEHYEVIKKLESIKIDPEDVAIVSVDCDLSDCLSSCIDTAIKQIKYELGRSWYSGNAGYPMFEYEYKSLARQFKKGDIWEYAILSKDKQSFVLVRDLLDKKVQPIENCIIANKPEANFDTDNITAKTLFDHNTEVMQKQADRIIALDPKNRLADYRCRVPSWARTDEGAKNYYPLDERENQYFFAPFEF